MCITITIEFKNIAQKKTRAWKKMVKFRLGMNAVSLLYYLFLTILSKVWTSLFKDISDEQCSDTVTNAFFKDLGKSCEKFSYFFALLCTISRFLTLATECGYYFITFMEEESERAILRERASI
jgi:hypothetical protein